MISLFRNKIAKNAGWLIGSKIAQSIIGLIVGMLTARFLGPSNYGLINYAASIVAFVAPIMNLGLSNILVQELTNSPEEEGKILGTSILLSLFSSFFCIAGVLSFTFIVDLSETTTHIVVGLYSIILIFQAFELIQYWYQKRLLSKYTAIVSLIAYVLVATYKIFLLIIRADVSFFAISNTIDYFLISASLLLLYWRLGGQRLSFSSQIGKRMLRKSKHYIVSSLMVTIFAQTDKIMIKSMIDETAVGYYSAAVTCAGLFGFVFAAIIDSFRPVVFSYKKNGDEFGYEESIKRLYSIIIYFALFLSVLMTIFAKYIVLLLYGEEYSNSILALRIIVWYTTFSYMGAVRNVWILGENKQKYLWIINLGGALLNIGLNFVFIPWLGIYGAAIASLVTQIFANVIMNVIVWPLHYNNVLMFKSLNPIFLIKSFKGK